MEINLAIAERARAGDPLTTAELDELAATDLLSLGMLADEVRRARVGNTVTYARVLEIDSSPAAADAAHENRLSHVPDTLAETEAAIKAARAVAGSRLLTGYSLADIANHESWGPL